MVSGHRGSKLPFHANPNRQVQILFLLGLGVLRQLLTDGLQPVFRSSADTGWQLVRGEIGMLRLPASLLQCWGFASVSTLGLEASEAPNTVQPRTECWPSSSRLGWQVEEGR